MKVSEGLASSLRRLAAAKRKLDNASELFQRAASGLVKPGSTEADHHAFDAARTVHSAETAWTLACVSDVVEAWAYCNDEHEAQFRPHQEDPPLEF